MVRRSASGRCAVGVPVTWTILCHSLCSELPWAIVILLNDTMVNHSYARASQAKMIRCKGSLKRQVVNDCSRPLDCVVWMEYGKSL